jgi:hypothetical protein
MLFNNLRQVVDRHGLYQVITHARRQTPFPSIRENVGSDGYDHRLAGGLQALAYLLGRGQVIHVGHHQNPSILDGTSRSQGL